MARSRVAAASGDEILPVDLVFPQQGGDLPGGNDDLVVVLLAELPQQRDQQIPIQFHGLAPLTIHGRRDRERSTTNWVVCGNIG